MENEIKLTGRVSFEVYQVKGKKRTLIDRVSLKNLVVTNGLYNVVKLLGNQGGVSITKFGVGTSGTATQPSDTSLEEQQVKALESNVIEGDQKSITFNFNVDTSEFNGMTIREFGLFTYEDNENVLFSRRVLDNPITKTVNIAITGTWTIAFNASED